MHTQFTHVWLQQTLELTPAHPQDMAAASGWETQEAMAAKGSRTDPLTEEGRPGGTFRTFLGCVSAESKSGEEGLSTAVSTCPRVAPTMLWSDPKSATHLTLEGPR